MLGLVDEGRMRPAFIPIRGAVLGGPRIVDDDVRQKMRDILAEIRAGRFSRQLAREAAADYPLLRDARATARRSAVETARRDLDAT